MKRHPSRLAGLLAVLEPAPSVPIDWSTVDDEQIAASDAADRLCLYQTGEGWAVEGAGSAVESDGAA